MSGNQLGPYLRSRREALSPTAVGLPAGGRRRTPGLRRAELATLAGVSVEYLTRLEQGRDRHPSAQILGSLADALLLGRHERVQLRLAAKGEMDGGCCVAEEPTRTVRSGIRALLHQLDHTPALVMNSISEVLARTSVFERLASPVGLLEEQPPNLVRFVLSDPRAREVFPDWSHVADRAVGQLKAWALLGDPHVLAFADELNVLAGNEFSARFAAATAWSAESAAERWFHPRVGMLRLEPQVMDVADVDDQRLIVYLAADGETSTALATLAQPPGGLHAVS